MNDLRIHHLTFAEDDMIVSFTDGRSIPVPLHSFPGLEAAPAARRAEWQLIGRGLGVHWEALDEDLSVENILLAYSRARKSDYALAAHA